LPLSLPLWLTIPERVVPFFLRLFAIGDIQITLSLTDKASAFNPRPA
jgi:hypothetical protein